MSILKLDMVQINLSVKAFNLGTDQINLSLKAHYQKKLTPRNALFNHLKQWTNRVHVEWLIILSCHFWSLYTRLNEHTRVKQRERNKLDRLIEIFYNMGYKWSRFGIVTSIYLQIITRCYKYMITLHRDVKWASILIVCFIMNNNGYHVPTDMKVVSWFIGCLRSQRTTRIITDSRHWPRHFSWIRQWISCFNHVSWTSNGRYFFV